MGMEALRGVAESVLADLRTKYDLAWRIYPVGLVVPNDPEAKEVKDSVRVAEGIPFLILAWAWASTRFYDAHRIRAALRIKERTFLDDPRLLGAIGGNQTEGSDLIYVPPAILPCGAEIEVTATAVLAPDPAETYPGPTIDSTIDFCFHGVDLLPKGAMGDTTPARE
jgi:hypothetical protein